MITLQEVEKQLEAIGANSRFWGRAEIVELQHILIPGEQIQSLINGRYHGGFATFVTTDQRLLLVDKKLFFLTVEDMRYDMIAEVDFSAQLLSGTIQVCTPTKNLTFTTFKPQALRQVASYIQQRVMQLRNQYDPQQQQQSSVSLQPAGLSAQSNQTTQTAAKPAPVMRGVYAALLGNQAVTGAEQEPALPSPSRRNPYMNAPMVTRRRIGRFGPIGTPQAPSA